MREKYLVLLYVAPFKNVIYVYTWILWGETLWAVILLKSEPLFLSHKGQAPSLRVKFLFHPFRRIPFVSHYRVDVTQAVILDQSSN